jgi:hypothetical protein
MDAATPSKRAKTTTTAAAVISPAGTPQKPKNSAAATLLAEQVATPEKMEMRPMLRTAAGNGVVALSVNEDRRAAIGQQRPDKGGVAVDEEEDARKLDVGAGAGRIPVKRSPEVKLPQS